MASNIENDCERNEDKSMIMMDACDKIKWKKTFLLAIDGPSRGLLDEVDPAFWNQRDTF